MKFAMPDVEVRGSGRIINPQTGEVTHFWIGSPEKLPTKQSEPQSPNQDIKE